MQSGLLLILERQQVTTHTKGFQVLVGQEQLNRLGFRIHRGFHANETAFDDVDTTDTMLKGQVIQLTQQVMGRVVPLLVGLRRNQC